MNDREMLELAAKAAGIERGADRFDGGISITDITGRHRSLPKWNPRDDDGDALRLAVTLALFESFDFWLKISTACSADGPLAATRRAIVKAAAEIGRGIAQSVGDDLPEDDYYKSLTGAEEIGRAAEIGKGMK